MSERLLLVDTDLFVLFGAAGLLQELAECFGVSLQCLRRLPAVEHQVRKSPRFRNKIPEPNQSVIEQAIVSTQPWTAEPRDSSVLERLIHSEGIDGGEGLLIAILAENPVMLLTTGDKRCLRALAADSSLTDVCESVRQRIASLETALILMVKRFGAELVATRLKPLCKSYQTLSILFEFKEVMEEDEILRQLASYLNDLENSVGPDFLYPC